MSKTVLITGAAGFIGSHLADKLLERGDKVVAIDEFNDYYDPSLKESNISQHSNNPNYSLYRIDFSEMSQLKPVFEENNIDSIVHLGARAGVRPSLVDPFIYIKANVIGTTNILELAKDHNIQDLVIASSSSVYGDRTEVPFIETDRTDSPVAPYAATKKEVELMSHVYHKAYNLNISLLRFFTVYGPRGRPDMAPMMFTKRILNGETIKMFGEGDTSRSYTYVDDVVAGTIAALDNPKPYEIYNIGNDKTVTLKDFISILEDICGRKAIIQKEPRHPADVPLTYASIEKAKEMLGYNPETDVKEGLRKMVDWYKERF